MIPVEEQPTGNRALGTLPLNRHRGCLMVQRCPDADSPMAHFTTDLPFNLRHLDTPAIADNIVFEIASSEITAPAAISMLH